MELQKTLVFPAVLLIPVRSHLEIKTALGVSAFDITLPSSHYSLEFLQCDKACDRDRLSPGIFLQGAQGLMEEMAVGG